MHFVLWNMYYALCFKCLVLCVMCYVLCLPTNWSETQVTKHKQNPEIDVCRKVRGVNHLSLCPKTNAQAMMMPPGVGVSSLLLNSDNFQTRRTCYRNHNTGKRNTCLHRVRQHWFILQYAFCIMHSVLCTMYDGLCIVYSVLCIMYYV